MSAEVLQRVGEALYGPRWQSEIARALEMSDRHMRRLVAGSSEVPPGVYEELLELCKARIAELQKVSAALSKMKK